MRGMSAKEAIALLMAGETIKFPIPYATTLFLELAASKFDKRFAGIIVKGEMAICLVKDIEKQ